MADTSDEQIRFNDALLTGELFEPIAFFTRNEQLMTKMIGLMNISSFRVYDAAVGGLTPIGMPNSAGDFIISTQPLWRMGIRSNSDNAAGAWEFIRNYILNINSGSFIEGFPIVRSLFEDEMNKELLGKTSIALGHVGYTDGLEIPEFTEELANVLIKILESITHEYFPDPHVYNIVAEEVFPVFEGLRSAEDAARIIQNRVQTYLNEMS